MISLDLLTTLPNATKNTISCFCRKRTLLAHVQPGIHQSPQVLFCQAAFSAVCTGARWCSCKGTWLCISYWTLRGSCQIISFQVSVGGSMTLWHTNCTSQFCAIGKLAGVHSAPLSRSLMKMLMELDPVLTPGVVTGLQVDFAVLITNCLEWLFCQFSIYLAVCSSIP